MPEEIPQQPSNNQAGSYSTQPEQPTPSAANQQYPSKRYQNVQAQATQGENPKTDDRSEKGFLQYLLAGNSTFKLPRGLLLLIPLTTTIRGGEFLIEGVFVEILLIIALYSFYKRWKPTQGKSDPQAPLS